MSEENSLLRKFISISNMPNNRVLTWIGLPLENWYDYTSKMLMRVQASQRNYQCLGAPAVLPGILDWHLCILQNSLLANRPSGPVTPGQVLKKTLVVSCFYFEGWFRNHLVHKRQIHSMGACIWPFPSHNLLSTSLNLTAESFSIQHCG